MGLCWGFQGVILGRKPFLAKKSRLIAAFSLVTFRLLVDHTPHFLGNDSIAP